MRRFSREVFNREVLGSPSPLAEFYFHLLNEWRFLGWICMVIWEVMVQKLQVIIILPILNAEFLACSCLLS